MAHSHTRAVDDEVTVPIQDMACAAFGAEAAALPKVKLNRYFVKNERLYYIRTITHGVNYSAYFIENCETDYTMWVSGSFLTGKEVTWI
jgi:hypothetical protein